MIYTMPRKYRRVAWIVTASLFVIYLMGPVVASMCEIGDLRGPKIYPRSLHAAIYLVTWELTEHEANKPRVPYDPTPRPWFYGF